MVWREARGKSARPPGAQAPGVSKPSRAFMRAQRAPNPMLRRDYLLRGASPGHQEFTIISFRNALSPFAQRRPDGLWRNTTGVSRVGERRASDGNELPIVSGRV